MNTELESELKSRLTQERERLESEIAELRDVAVKATTYLEDENDTSDNHMADDASSLTERQTDMTLLANLEREFADTEGALERMAQGQYGICEVCGEQIAEKRLLARPMATTCIDCQTTLELRQRIQASAT